jgi:hypothetical protein
MAPGSVCPDRADCDQLSDVTEVDCGGIATPALLDVKIDGRTVGERLLRGNSGRVTSRACCRTVADLTEQRDGMGVASCPAPYTTVGQCGEDLALPQRCAALGAYSCPPSRSADATPTGPTAGGTSGPTSEPAQHR